MKNRTLILFATSIMASCGGGGGGGSAGPAPALTYAPKATLFLHGAEIAALTPEIVGPATHFQVTPALPLGLQLDPATGTIQGTPEELSDLTWYEISATGQENVRLRLGVAPPPRFGVVGNTADSTLSVYTVDAHNGRTGFHGYLPTPRARTVLRTS